MLPLAGHRAQVPYGVQADCQLPGTGSHPDPTSHTVPREMHTHMRVCVRACVWFEGNIIQDTW